MKLKDFNLLPKDTSALSIMYHKMQELETLDIDWQAKTKLNPSLTNRQALDIALKGLKFSIDDIPRRIAYGDKLLLLTTGDKLKIKNCIRLFGKFL